MILPDVNILVYTHRADSPEHTAYLSWFENELNSERAFGISDIVLSGFIRIVTHPRIFKTPSTLAEALAFTEQIKTHPNCVAINPGRRHWEIFKKLCGQANVKGNLVPDAYLAAIAIESGSEWITTDRDFSRFTELRWRHPLN